MRAIQYQGCQIGKKLLIYLESKAMTSDQGNAFLFSSSQQLPSYSLGPMKGFLSWQGTLQGPSTTTRAMLPELWRYKDTVESGVAHLARTLSKTNRNKPWLYACWKHTHFHWSKKLGAPCLPLSTPLDLLQVHILLPLHAEINYPRYIYSHLQNFPPLRETWFFIKAYTQRFWALITG